MSVQDSESRHLEHLAERFSGRSWVKISPGSIFFGVFERFQTFFPKIFANSEQYRNLLAGIFEILTVFRKPRVSIVTGPYRVKKKMRERYKVIRTIIVNK